MAKTGPFEKYGDLYDKWFDENKDLYEAELALIKHLLPCTNTRSLEVSIGSGVFAGPLGLSTGVDPSKRMADRTQKRGLDVCLGIAEDLPFSDSIFQCVLMVTTICFVDDAPRSLREVFRVLAPGGSMVLAFIDKQSPLGRKYQSKKEQSKFYREANFFSCAELIQHLKSAGFEIAKIYQTLLPGNDWDTVLEGYGQGSFVAIRGVKNKSPTK